MATTGREREAGMTDGAGLHIAVLVKQVPRFDRMELGPDGRLVREGLELEMNPYCRRAVTAGVDLVREHGGCCTVVTLGPPAAEDVLREAVAWGADDGVLVTDRAFAGSDTLATARALAAVLRREGPFDLVLVGRNSVDADTGQVGPQLAELLDVAFVAGARRLELRDGILHSHLEHDDGWADVEAPLPAVVSCAERLCEPCKMPEDARAAVDPARLRTVSAADLGAGPWGEAGSPTRVGPVRAISANRDRTVLSGPVEDQVEAALDLLAARGISGRRDRRPAEPPDAVPDHGAGDGPVVAVVVEPGRTNVTRELLGAAARLAEMRHGSVAAVVPAAAASLTTFTTWGADGVLLADGAAAAEDMAGVVAAWCAEARPWAVLVPSTMWGREVAGRAAARLDAGLTGDAIDLTVDGDGRLVAWKPAFGGQLAAAITSTSDVQLVTVRPGVLALLAPRPPGRASVGTLPVQRRNRVRTLGSGRDDDVDRLASAAVVVGAGAGVANDRYHELDELLDVLGAELAATRKVTDKAWQPRSRQIGITGRSLQPELYVAVGVSGKFNHMVGVRGAGTIVAINADREAPVFGECDIGIVADWREAVPLLVDGLSADRLENVP
jgi:electron transfer flavoprotein alpha subunit